MIFRVAVAHELLLDVDPASNADVLQVPEIVELCVPEGYDIAQVVVALELAADPASFRRSIASSRCCDRSEMHFIAKTHFLNHLAGYFDVTVAGVPRLD